MNANKTKEVIYIIINGGYITKIESIGITVWMIKKENTKKLSAIFKIPFIQFNETDLMKKLSKFILNAKSLFEIYGITCPNELVKYNNLPIYFNYK
jgi:hypothetical protein